MIAELVLNIVDLVIECERLLLNDGRLAARKAKESISRGPVFQLQGTNSYYRIIDNFPRL